VPDETNNRRITVLTPEQELVTITLTRGQMEYLYMAMRTLHATGSFEERENERKGFDHYPRTFWGDNRLRALCRSLNRLHDRRRKTIDASSSAELFQY
jgi:hypothetical protein